MVTSRPLEKTTPLQEVGAVEGLQLGPWLERTQPLHPTPPRLQPPESLACLSQDTQYPSKRWKFAGRTAEPRPSVAVPTPPTSASTGC